MPVVLQLRNRPEMLTALFGLAELGAIAVPLNRDAPPTELLHAYAACGARWAVVEDRLLEQPPAPAAFGGCWAGGHRRQWLPGPVLGASPYTG